ncbi:MAG: tetratricopeptide repeat protein [Deltaproteobacteria bacterium]|nr:tetratricopeptide repeat protein [Deltaproteobacteria bacterium]
MSNDLYSLNRQKTLLTVLFLSAIILAAYWQVQSYEFTNFDDQLYVLNNKNIQSGFTATSIRYAFTDISTSNWHPLTMLSHMLDWTIYGKNAGGHHWTNIIIHIISTVLLFFFLKTTTGFLGRSALIAALFAVHPINVESVAWIAERKNVLCTFFWILTLLLYVRYVRRPGWKTYLPVVLSFTLGIMSKPMVVTLPFALLLLDYWPLKRTPIDLNHADQTPSHLKAAPKAKLTFLVLEKIPLFALSAFSIFMTVYAAKAANSIVTLQAIPFDKRIANVIVSYALYLKKILWPFDFSVLYPFNDQIPLWQIILAALLILAVTVLMCRYYRKYPYLPVGWFWYLGTLVPVIGIVHVGHQSMADRYAYIPFVGLFLILTWGFTTLLKKRISTKATAFVCVGIIAILMILTDKQVRYWENSYTLYQNAIRVSSQHYLPHKNLALYLIDQKQPREAVEHLKKAIALKKNDPTLHNSLGVALDMLGKDQEAKQEYMTALQLRPTHAIAHNNLGLLFVRQKRYDEAVKHLREAVRLQPDLVMAHFYLAKALKEKGAGRKAEIHHETAVRMNPDLRNLK